MYDEYKIGKIGEYLTCADLLSKGFNVTIASEGLPYDILLDTGKKILKVQVKSTVKPKRVANTPLTSPPKYRVNFKICGKRYKRKYSKEDIDIFALVAIDTKSVGYISENMNINSLNIKSEEFRGKYSDEISKEKRILINSLLGEGKSKKEIEEITGFHRYKIKSFLKEPTWNRTCEYFKDIERDKEWFLKL